MLVVDPMHNLFLGTAKYILSAIWLERNIITKDQLDVIQQRVDNVQVPSDIGRIPYKISLGFTSFTADQFKNWVIYYSLISMRGILTGDHLECWRHFVLACRILVCHQISHEKLQLADALLLRFCSRFERLYGTSSVMPNMHLHAHLRECILDFGPLHGFWCFAFERYNGILGEIPNNNRSIEIQVMDRFIRESNLMSFSYPELFSDKFENLMPHQKSNSLLETTTESHISTLVGLSPEITSLLLRNGRSTTVSYSLPGVATQRVFCDSELASLKFIYSRLFSIAESEVEMSSIYIKYSTIKINNILIGSIKSKSSNTSLVLGLWMQVVFCSLDLNESSTSAEVTLESEERPLQINFFAKHSVTLNGVHQEIILACVSWFKPHACKNDLWKTYYCMGA